MKKLLVILVVITALFISGCSDKGVLRINNWSSYDAWYVIGNGDLELLDAGYYVEYDWDLSTSIFGDEEKNVNVEIGGEYIFTEMYHKTIKPGSSVKIDIDTNAGEIIVWNDTYAKYIVEVYISPSEDTEWGDDDLVGDIGPSEYVSWYLSPGEWDVLVVDDWGNEYFSFNNYVGLEETYWFHYTGAKSAGNSAEEKIINAQKSTQDIKERIQQNDK